MNQTTPAAATRHHRLVQRFVTIAAGFVLVSTAVIVDAILDQGVPPLVSFVFIVTGCAFVVFGAFWRDRRLGELLAKSSLAILSIAFLLAGLEAVFRAIKFDFNRLHEFPESVPIYYRPPTLPAGVGVFRRPGPASWNGKVLSAYMRIHGTSEGPYADEQPVTAEYDSFGFRNPADLTDWEMVVTGDSFVELGYLPYEGLFTTLAAKRLGVRIKNLGVSCTGPVSQTFYVRNYGKAASTKDAVLCLFEGNDLNDLDRELRNRASFRATGQAFERQSQVSFIRALCDEFKLRRRAAELSLERVTSNALLVSANQERPMTVYATPPVWDRLSRNKRETLVRALEDWANTAREKEMRPWVMYIPDSHRVFHGLIRYFDTNSAVAHWKPGEFAAPLGQICTNLNIRFIDTYPSLRAEAQAGRVPYNLIGDTHLSAEGSRVVAEVIANALETRQGR